jgi:hypothetical protein
MARLAKATVLMTDAMREQYMTFSRVFQSPVDLMAYGLRIYLSVFRCDRLYSARHVLAVRLSREDQRCRGGARRIWSSRLDWTITARGPSQRVVRRLDLGPRM